MNDPLAITMPNLKIPKENGHRKIRPVTLFANVIPIDPIEKYLCKKIIKLVR